MFGSSLAWFSGVDRAGYTADMHGTITSVSSSGVHEFSKSPLARIQLLAGLGVEGDAHSGVLVQHRSRVAANPNQPNLRQVHLMQAELHDELQAKGFAVTAGQLGENITTRGIALLELPRGTRLYLGPEAIVEITGLRNPCPQIENFMPKLLAAVLDQDEHGNIVRKAGIMGIVLASGEVKPDDAIRLELPALPHLPLERV